MARGNYWEVIYDAEGVDPTEIAEIESIRGTNGLHHKILRGTKSNIKRRASERPLTFSNCTIKVAIDNSQITNCTFTRCLFNETTFTNVKFSNCHFKECHFRISLFDQCYFIDNCSFIHNSASAELFRLRGTALAASNFIGNLVTNVQNLPATASKDYQLFRFSETRQKIAYMLFESVRSEPNTRYIDEAFKEYICADLRFRIDEFRYVNRDPAKPRSPRSFWWFSLPLRVERQIVLAVAWLSDWGRNYIRPLAFFCATILIFSIIYYKLSDRNFEIAFIKACNITLVAGYTAYYGAQQSGLLKMIETINLSVGLLWYSLLIPLISRRIQR